MSQNSHSGIAPLNREVVVAPSRFDLPVQFVLDQGAVRSEGLQAPFRKGSGVPLAAFAVLDLVLYVDHWTTQP